MRLAAALVMSCAAMLYALLCVLLAALRPSSGLAAERLACPAEPPALAHAGADVRTRIHASAGEIGKTPSSELEARLRARYPQLEPALLEQALHAAYCQRLRAQPQLSEAPLKRWQALHASSALAAQTVSRQTVRPAPASPGPPVEVALRAGGAAPPGEHAPPAEPFVPMPQFPWPPPPPSASRVIPAAVLTARIKELDSRTARAANGRLRLRDIGAVLRHALRGAGYEFRYYGTPHGFALAARLERIDDQGSPYPQPERFDARFRPLERLSLVGYLQALFLAPAGHYRVMTFIVSPAPFRSTGRPVSVQEAGAWLDGGVNVLPEAVGDKEYKLPNYACTALIYEFDKRDTQSNPVALLPGRLSADTHLERSGIARLLWKQNQAYP